MYRYPDNSTVDCSADQAVAPTTGPPPGWSCLDEGGDGEVRVFGDENGNVGLLFQMKDVPRGSGKTFGSAGIVGSSNVAVFKGSLAGFVRLPEPVDVANARVQLTVTRVAADGTPPFLGSGSIDAHVTRYQTDAWIVWAFADGPSTYYFSTMAGITTGDATVYQPVNLNQTGADFDLRISPQTLRFVGDYTRPTAVQAQTGIGGRCDPGTMD